MRPASTISVVIPTCDRAGLMREAIDSVLCQTSPPLEIIVVDNGKEAVRLDLASPLIKLLRIDALAGVSRARNTGAEIASGEYIAFLDDDDQWSPDYLQRAELIIQQRQPDVILAALTWIANGRVEQTRCLPERYTYTDLFLGNYVSGSNTVVRKAAFVQAGGYETALSWSEDVTLVMHMRSQGARIMSSQDMHTLYRQHPGARLTTATPSGRDMHAWEQNLHLLDMRHRMYHKMRVARGKAREKRSVRHYLISRGYRLAYKALSALECLRYNRARSA